MPKQDTPKARQAENALAFRAYSTATLARHLDIKPASIRTAVWRHGHFHGVRPLKLGQGQRPRLLWPADQVEALLQRGAA